MSDLPLHGGRNGRGQSSGPVQKLQNAFDRTVSMAGLRPTKAGAGDKERAFIVKQNFMLKVVLFLAIVFLVGVGIVFSTILKVSVTRRGAISSERVHHELEHQANLKLMRAHVELQKALEHEVHEMDRIEEFRSSTDKVIGEAVNQVTKLLKDANVDATVMKEVERVQEIARHSISSSLMNIIVHFQSITRKAKLDLKRIAHAIVSDIELDVKETDRYRAKMKRDFKIDVDKLDSKPVDFKNDEFLGKNVVDDDSADNEDFVAKELDNFFKKLQSHDFPLIEEAVIQSWETEMVKINKIIDDTGGEADMDRIANQINAMIALHAPGVPKFESKENSLSVIDYFELRIEEAKLSIHKQELMDLYDGWKTDRKISPLTVLAGVEKVAEENNMYLLYEWLDGDDPDK